MLNCSGHTFVYKRKRVCELYTFKTHLKFESVSPLKTILLLFLLFMKSNLSVPMIDRLRLGRHMTTHELYHDCNKIIWPHITHHSHSETLYQFKPESENTTAVSLTCDRRSHRRLGCCLGSCY